MQKWEYCVITGIMSGVDGFLTNYPKLCHLTSKGCELVTNFKKRPRGVSERDAVAQAIADLGENGWEMIASGLGIGETTSLYFKRPKHQE